jgi:hypothetical protein
MGRKRHYERVAVTRVIITGKTAPDIVVGDIFGIKGHIHKLPLSVVKLQAGWRKHLEHNSHGSKKIEGVKQSHPRSFNRHVISESG